MSCVREASPPLPNENSRHDMKKRRFLQPLRGLRRIFRKKGRQSVTSDGHVDAITNTRITREHLNTSGQSIESNFEPAKSHSTSHLDDDQPDNAQRRSLQSTMLSVSHDSIFTSEQRSPDSGSETSLYAPTTRLGFPHSSVKAELFEAVRRRRKAENNSSDDEDLGLPRSPISNSPTTADDMFTKENMVTKSSQSTCSDGSLLSMGSSEIDDESSYCYNSRHSSKLSLYEKRTSTGSDLQRNDRSTNFSNGDAASLSHSAAKHKMAVKPKRNHGAPHKKRQLITSNTLPTTPEVNEENNQTRTTPVNGSTKEKPVADTRLCDEHQPSESHIHKTRSGTDHHTSVTHIGATNHNRQQKFSSLPPIVSVSPASSFKFLNRSKSNATSPRAATTPDDATENEDERDASRKEEGASFFSRLLLRRSSKKRRNAAEEAESHKEESGVEHASMGGINEAPVSMTYVNGTLTNAMKHHPLFRQRVEPFCIPSREPKPLPAFSSTVPVNMPDTMVVTPVVDAAPHKLPTDEKSLYLSHEDTPSLRVNIGSPNSPPISEKTTPDYENLNRLSIVVNDSGEGMSLLDIVTDNKQKTTTQTADVKIPIPAPRTSLLNHSSSNPQAVEWSGSSSIISSISSANENLNMTVNENVDGQKSIISIGSISDYSAEVQQDAEYQQTPEDLLPKSDDLEDDVFQVHTELAFAAVESPIRTSPVASEAEENSVELVEQPTPLVEKSIEHESFLPTSVLIPPMTPAPAPPVIITNPNADIVKVNDPTVVIRKKSTRNSTQKRDEEPELMKVFARRSLKLKEDDETIYETTKSRDSDKENEGDSNMSSAEESEKKRKNEAPEAVIAAIPPKPAVAKFHRSVSNYETEKNVLSMNNTNEKRPRCKSTPNEFEKYVSEEKDTLPLSVADVTVNDEKPSTPFKRIQQRREEWEKRAQQAMIVQGTR